MSDEIKALRAELDALTAQMKTSYIKMAQAMVEGKNQTEAYVESGGKAKDPYAGASEMLKLNPNISQYVLIAKKLANLEVLPEKFATLEQKRRMLWQIAEKCFEEKSEKWEGRGEHAEMVGFVFDSRGAIAAIAELNKMDGDLAAIKTDNKHSGTIASLLDELIDGNG